jgi:hypothetical protein
MNSRLKAAPAGSVHICVNNAPAYVRENLKSLHIYDGCFSRGLNFPELVSYLQAVIPGLAVHLHREFIHCHAGADAQNPQDNRVRILAEKFAAIKIVDPRQQKRGTQPLPGEIEYEKRRLVNTVRQPWGILYDAEKLLELCSAMLPTKEMGMHVLHLAVTNQLFGTWDHNDLRYHARTGIYGFPSILSTTGLVEAPAKSRTYYQSRQMGLSYESLEDHFQGEFLVHDDPRLTEIIKGYIMQAVFYCLEGDPFCSDHNCRLYNAHWQHEMLHAQLNAPYEFCPLHAGVLNSLHA